MPNLTMKVRARGRALVTDYEAMADGVRRFIGRQVDHSTVDHKRDIGIAFNPTGKDAEVPVTAEYMRHVQHGDLYAADAETAQLCGVDFDPTFGAPASTGGKADAS